MMVVKICLGSLLLGSVPAPHPPPPPPSPANSLNWAFLVAGSNTYANYRHQADLCHAYQILVSKGFNRDRILTMAYDDIANHSSNPFPGKLFSSPDPDGPGVDVYEGCRIDYKGKDVTASNFVSLLLGNGATGGNGRLLDTTSVDDLFIFYVDHGAPGFIEFPDGDVVHAEQLQATLQSMHQRGRYNRMVIYIEACYSGTMLENLPHDTNIYGVTAVGINYPSLGAYCGYESVIDGTPVGACLGDLFTVWWLKYVLDGDGNHSLNEFFDSVFENVVSFAAIHYGHMYNQQYGDLTMGRLTVGDFLHGDSQSDVQLAVPLLPQWHPPYAVFAAPRLAVDERFLEYADASAQPLFHGNNHWERMQEATQDLRVLLKDQEDTHQLYWDLVTFALPHDQDRQHQIWITTAGPRNPQCEVNLHHALVHFCADTVDIKSSYALQFHQVVVNLCNDETLGWTDADTKGGYAAAARACRNMATSRMSWTTWVSSLIWDPRGALGEAEDFIV